jgi:HK97 gp10 family phage protein
MAVTVQVEGLAALNAALENLETKMVNKYLRAAAKEASSTFVEHAQRLAPVLKKPVRGRTPGALKRSIIAKVSITKRKGLVVKIGPAKAVFYARHVEFGTNKMKAQPYMRPAWDGEKSRALTAFADSLRQSIASFRPNS